MHKYNGSTSAYVIMNLKKNTKKQLIPVNIAYC